VLRRIKEAERIWMDLDRVLQRHKLPDRMIFALYDAVQLFRVRNAVYRATLEEAGEPISDQMASRDLRQLVEMGLLEARGERRGRYYVAASPILQIRSEMRADRNPRDETDPFADAD
jgi:Fic family protein